MRETLLVPSLPLALVVLKIEAIPVTEAMYLPLSQLREKFNPSSQCNLGKWARVFFYDSLIQVFTEVSNAPSTCKVLWAIWMLTKSLQPLGIYSTDKKQTIHETKSLTFKELTF